MSVTVGTMMPAPCQVPIEKIVVQEKIVEVPVEKFVEVPSPRCACLDSLRLQGTFCCNYVFRYATDVTLGGAGGKGGLP
jgi:hypothetical protein